MSQKRGSGDTSADCVMCCVTFYEEVFSREFHISRKWLLITYHSIIPDPRHRLPSEIRHIISANEGGKFFPDLSLLSSALLSKLHLKILSNAKDNGAFVAKWGRA